MEREQFKEMISDVLGEVLKEHLDIEISEEYVEPFSDEKRIRTTVYWKGAKISEY